MRLKAGRRSLRSLCAVVVIGVVNEGVCEGKWNINSVLSHIEIDIDFFLGNNPNFTDNFLEADIIQIFGEVLCRKIFDKFLHTGLDPLRQFLCFVRSGKGNPNAFQLFVNGYHILLSFVHFNQAALYHIFDTGSLLIQFFGLLLELVHINARLFGNIQLDIFVAFLFNAGKELLTPTDNMTE